jgi:hypothetical protein
MRVLFVAPVEVGSGETITVRHMAERILKRSGRVRVLASRFARRLLGEGLSDLVQSLTDDGEVNRALWDASLRDFRPDVVVFADYPLLAFSNGVTPLWSEAWARSLDTVEPCLVTLDHTGYAQRPIGVFFGPPHLSFHHETIPAIPPRMRILLPCPMHSPGAVPGRKGQPFRYWDVPLAISPDTRASIRRRFLSREDDFLIFHAAARWAWQSAEAAGLAYYRLLPRILDFYFRDLPRPVTIVSVNDGALFDHPVGGSVRIINIPSVSSPLYDALLLASDLLLTENKISISLGKAICALLPCVTLRNSYRLRALLASLSGELLQIVTAMEAARPGAVYPYGVFPLGMDDELDRLGLYHQNPITHAFHELELYGGSETRRVLHGLLTDPLVRHALRARQQTYVDCLSATAPVEDALQRLVAEEASALAALGPGPRASTRQARPPPCRGGPLAKGMPNGDPRATSAGHRRG